MAPLGIVASDGETPAFQFGLSGYTALFGGSFNPPHCGHQLACLYLLEGLGADAVWLLPSSRHPFGKHLSAFEHRLRMCELVGEPLGGRVVVSDVERRLGGEGRTFDTIVALSRENKSLRFALVVGADILAETGVWYRWDDIAAMVRIVVVGRGGHPQDGDSRNPPLEMPTVSSSQIRQLVATAGNIEGLVPRSVKQYIREHQLYA